MRTLCIGDIHGAYVALQQVLDRCNFDPASDKVIFLGDYVDGWSESAKVVQLLMDLEKIADTVFIRGNHDDWCDQWMRSGVSPNYWLSEGGQATFDSYLGCENKGLHHRFFRNLHNYYIDDQNRGFVHGGFTSRKGLGYEPSHTNYFWDRDLWQLALLSHRRVHTKEGSPQGRRFERHHEIFIGHTTTNLWKCKPHYPEYDDPNQVAKNGEITVPMNRCNVWNLDTGAGWIGKLTIMDIDTKEYWQSDYVAELYPEEKGRR